MSGAKNSEGGCTGAEPCASSRIRIAALEACRVCKFRYPARFGQEVLPDSLLETRHDFFTRSSKSHPCRFPRLTSPTSQAESRHYSYQSPPNDAGLDIYLFETSHPIRYLLLPPLYLCSPISRPRLLFSVPWTLEQALIYRDRIVFGPVQTHPNLQFCSNRSRRIQITG